MRPSFSNLACLVALALGFMLTAPKSPAQVTTLLHSFGDGTTLPSTITNFNDASNPTSNLVEGRDGNFYGTTTNAGPDGNGVAFVMTPNGTVTIIHIFGDGTTPNDGTNPMGALIQGTGNDNNFYGTTANGGDNTNGTAFSMTPSGQVTILHSFGGSALNVDGSPAPEDAIFPESGLIRGSDGNFYGTSSNGGSNGVGTAFSMSPAGVVTILHSFTFGTTDLSFPETCLVQARNGTFYGIATSGGDTGNGGIFSITAGGQFALIHSFGDGAFALNGAAVTDGIQPQAAPLVQGQGTDNNFYGTTPSGGANGLGTVFFVTAAGRVTILYSFGNTSTDGDTPEGGLAEDAAGNFYGTASGQTNGGNGLVFKVTPAGVETVLHQFNQPVDTTTIHDDGTLVDKFLGDDPNNNNAPIYTEGDGFNPVAGLILGADNNLYGSTSDGGGGPILNFTSQPSGTLFKIAIGTPSLTGPEILSGNVGTGVGFTVTGTNNPAQFAAAGLPAGLSIDASTGTIAGIPTAIGRGDATIVMTNSAGSNTLLLPFDITNFSAGVSLSLVLNPPPTTGGANPTFWTISPTTLPPNLMFDSSTGTLSGTPTVAGNFDFVITAHSSDGTPRATQTYPVTVPETFSTWASTYTSAHPTFTNTAAGATPLNDAVPNLLKYIFDIDPTGPMTATDRAALPVAAMTTVGNVSYLTLTYRQFQFETGVTIQIQQSSDLKTWLPAAPSGQPAVAPDLQQQVGTDSNTGDPIMQVGFRAATTGNQFIRINVASP
jgi:uncharacterized repeat protein (TIGR03803 family)